MVFVSVAPFVFDNGLGLWGTEEPKSALAYDDSGAPPREAVGQGSVVFDQISARVLR